MRKRLRKKKYKYKGMINVVPNDILFGLEYIKIAGTNEPLTYVNHHPLPKFKIVKYITTTV